MRKKEKEQHIWKHCKMSKKQTQKRTQRKNSKHIQTNGRCQKEHVQRQGKNVDVQGC